MKNNKKIVAVLCAVITLVFAFSACTNSEKDLTVQTITPALTDTQLITDTDNGKTEIPTDASTPSEEPVTSEATSPTARESVTLTFVSINDLHGYILQDENGKNGLSNTAYLIDTMSAYFNDNDPLTSTRDDIVLFANGDMFQGTAISNMGKGEAVIKAMNEMGFDGMGIGNHEFDWGLDTILKYWDGIEENGEANFPLLSANITQASKGKLIGNISNEDNCVTYTIVEKCDVKVGLISVIGPCQNSILQTMLSDYTLDDVTQSVYKAALELDELGAELISVNIHYGTSNKVSDYNGNKEIAMLKNSKGEYLVDLIFNGHTHYKQSGVISRQDGTSVPVVQAGANNDAIGYIKLTYDPVTDITTTNGYGYRYSYEAGTNYDKNVEKVIDEYYDSYISNMEALAYSDVTVKTKYDLTDYTADVMIKALGSDYSASNYGGLRSNGNITAGNAITEEMIYSIIPFDNKVIFVTIQGSALYDFYTKQEDYCYFGQSPTAPSWYSLRNDDNYYTLAIIDYVYTGNYFTGSYADYTPYISSAIDTGLILRDLIVLDISLYGESDKGWNPEGGAIIQKQDWK